MAALDPSHKGSSARIKRIMIKTKNGGKVVSYHIHHHSRVAIFYYFLIKKNMFSNKTVGKIKKKTNIK